jgi:hypothetical protein
MSDPWQTLRDGGLPIATSRRGGPPSPELLSRCARDVISAVPTGRDADALAAWLAAWRDHWPTTFTRWFGDDAAIVDWIETRSVDRGRHIKLRRIALENLASVL